MLLSFFFLSHRRYASKHAVARVSTNIPASMLHLNKTSSTQGTPLFMAGIGRMRYNVCRAFGQLEAIRSSMASVLRMTRSVNETPCPDSKTSDPLRVNLSTQLCRRVYLSSLNLLSIYHRPCPRQEPYTHPHPSLFIPSALSSRSRFDLD